MGPRGMRIRPPFGPRGPPPFDPREADPFFRPPFDDVRGPPGPHMRPFGPMGPPTMHGPEGPWRNQESGAPGPWTSSQSSSTPETDNHSQRENHLARDKQKGTKHTDYKNNISDRENRNRSRKSRWGNVSPPITENTDEATSAEGIEDKTDLIQDGNFENIEPKSEIITEYDQSVQMEHDSPTDREQVEEQNDVHHLKIEQNEETNNEELHENQYNEEEQSSSYQSNVDATSGNDVEQNQCNDDKQCEYQTVGQTEDSSQQCVEQVEKSECVSENNSDQQPILEQAADAL